MCVFILIVHVRVYIWHLTMRTCQTAVCCWTLYRCINWSIFNIWSSYTHALFIVGPDGMTLVYTTKRIWYDFRSHIGDPLRISYRRDYFYRTSPVIQLYNVLAIPKHYCMQQLLYAMQKREIRRTSRII